MQAAYQNDLRLLIVYEGPNSCDMNAQQKIDAILSTYLPNAGFCIEGQRISYCGKNTNYNGLVFTYTRWNDSRSIMLRPSK
jgi:hypothetical protein